MKCHQLLLTISGYTVLTLAATPSFAIPAMDIRAEDMMRQANDIKASLNMTPNQVMLWQQVQTKINRLLQSRLSRRDQLQTDLKHGVGKSKTELRDLAAKLNAEEDLSNQENKQLRELWLTMNDALDDNQQQIVFEFLLDQLERSADPDKPEATRKQGDGHGRNGGRRSGGMSGGFAQ